MLYTVTVRAVTATSADFVSTHATGTQCIRSFLKLKLKLKLKLVALAALYSR